MANRQPICRTAHDDDDDRMISRLELITFVLRHVSNNYFKTSHEIFRNAAAASGYDCLYKTTYSGSVEACECARHLASNPQLQTVRVHGTYNYRV